MHFCLLSISWQARQFAYFLAWSAMNLILCSRLWILAIDLGLALWNADSAPQKVVIEFALRSSWAIWLGSFHQVKFGSTGPPSVVELFGGVLFVSYGQLEIPHSDSHRRSRFSFRCKRDNCLFFASNCSWSATPPSSVCILQCWSAWLEAGTFRSCIRHLGSNKHSNHAGGKPYHEFGEAVSTLGHSENPEPKSHDSFHRSLCLLAICFPCQSHASKARWFCWSLCVRDHPQSLQLRW